MIFDRIFDNISPQIKILNMVILILVLLQFWLIIKHCKPHKATRNPTECDVINYVKLFAMFIAGYVVEVVYQHLYSLSVQAGFYGNVVECLI